MFLLMLLVYHWKSDSLESSERLFQEYRNNTGWIKEVRLPRENALLKVMQGNVNSSIYRGLKAMKSKQHQKCNITEQNVPEKTYLINYSARNIPAFTFLPVYFYLTADIDEQSQT